MVVVHPSAAEFKHQLGGEDDKLQLQSAKTAWASNVQTVIE